MSQHQVEASEDYPGADPHPALVGADGLARRDPPPRRGDLKPALARLGDPSPGQVLLATDFDGTLAPIVPRPPEAAALPANLAILTRLVELGVHVAIISGRGQPDLVAKVPVSGARVIGDNGLGLLGAHERRALDRFNAKIGKLVGPIPGAWIEVKPGSTSVHYRGAPAAGPTIGAAVLPLAARFGLVAQMGRMVFEVRPHRADKARIMATLIEDLQPKAIIYAGDDEPDRSVFELLWRLPRRHLCIGVCSEERPPDTFSRCELVFEGPSGMTVLLRALLERVARHLPG